MNDKALTTIRGSLATADILSDFGRFLRLHTAEGDASEHTLRSHFSNVRQFVGWSQEQDMNPATATEDDLIAYRKHLVDGHLEDLGPKAEGISCHALRHSAATWARAGGAALDSIAAMLGHASVTTTQVYAQIVDRMTENPARYLEAVMET